MAGRELIVASNPAKRRTSAAQRAAARRNIKKAQAARRRKSGSAPKRRRTSTATRRRKSPTRRRTTRKGMVRKTARRAYRNPVRAKLIPKNLVERQLMPALIGGGGAVLNDSAYSLVMARLAGMLPGGIGMQLTGGPLRHAGKAGSALLMTWLASFVLTRKTAEQMGAGALTVVGYNIVRELAERFAPQIPLGAYIEPGTMGWPSAGTSGGGTLNPRTGSELGIRSGLAAYVRPNRARGLSAVPQLATRGQLTMPDPFTPSSRSPALEGYGGYG